MMVEPTYSISTSLSAFPKEPGLTAHTSSLNNDTINEMKQPKLNLAYT
jgi:hypothetical protein